MKDISLESFAGQPIRLQPIFRERVWGRDSLMPYFERPVGMARVGEVWFTLCRQPNELAGKA